MKKTEWIPCTVNPVRVGWYEFSAGSKSMTPVSNHWWDGKKWRLYPSFKIAFREQKYGFWRGLTEESK